MGMEASGEDKVCWNWVKRDVPDGQRKNLQIRKKTKLNFFTEKSGK